MRQYQPLSRWQFCPGETPDWSAAASVTIPHTWNIDPETETLWGTAWYRCTLPSCPGPRQFVRFGAVYRDARVFLNGCPVGIHTGSGYTPFEVELTSAWQENGENVLTLQVDNRFSTAALPYARSFDWANDGGLIRPVTLWSCGSHRLSGCRVSARPLIPELGQRLDSGAASFSARGCIDGPDADDLTLVWKVCADGEEQQPVGQGELSCKAGTFALPEQLWQQVAYWHFDAPHLYTLTLALYREGVCLDEMQTVFGFRELRLNGPELCLNGEPVRLCGTEWMPGSDPAFGMAEPGLQLEKMLTLLKGSNCVLTRFHWQQDEQVYDWCDRHGILVQEEVPFWGKDPEEAGPEQLAEFARQITEMVEAHGNHPCIFAWGVGNELDAQLDGTKDYIRRAVALAREQDPQRLVNYVSNTMFGDHDPAKDGTALGDVLMINDYIGTWHGPLDPQAEWDRIVAAHPDRAMIPAEFGLCEPAFAGGDARRADIFLEKMAQYRTIPNIVGTIYFCLNDYRTHMGEDGDGRLRRRVHGSTDWSGVPKPSYETVRRECSPLTAEILPEGVRFTCRDTLPRYTVQGYVLCQGDKRIPVPTLRPGESWLCTAVQGTGFSVLRPTGDTI